MESCVPVSSIEAPLVEFYFPYFFVLPVEEEVIGSSIRASLEEFKDFFPIWLLVMLPSIFPPWRMKKGGSWRLMLVESWVLERLISRW